jgi:hypothetical protein
VSATQTEAQGTYGLIAEFASEGEVVAAARAAREAGYSRMDAYTPYPVEALNDALALPRSKVPLIVLIGGILGGLGGFMLQYWSSVIRYPMNVGGRPFNSWPAFIVVTFECTILLAAISGVIGMILLNKLPQPYHPVFNWERFVHASRDRFYLCIEAVDPEFDRQGTETFLRSLNPSEVTDVEN